MRVLSNLPDVSDHHQAGAPEAHERLELLARIRESELALPALGARARRSRAWSRWGFARAHIHGVRVALHTRYSYRKDAGTNYWIAATETPDYEKVRRKAAVAEVRHYKIRKCVDKEKKVKGQVRTGSAEGLPREARGRVRARPHWRAGEGAPVHNLCTPSWPRVPGRPQKSRRRRRPHVTSLLWQSSLLLGARAAVTAARVPLGRGTGAAVPEPPLPEMRPEPRARLSAWPVPARRRGPACPPGAWPASRLSSFLGENISALSAAWVLRPYLEVRWQLPYRVRNTAPPSFSPPCFSLCLFVGLFVSPVSCPLCFSLCVVCPSLLSLASPLLRWGLERALTKTTMLVS